MRLKPLHCVKSAWIWSYSRQHFSCIPTEYGEMLAKILWNTGEMQTRITPNTNAFYGVLIRMRLYAQHDFLLIILLEIYFRFAFQEHQKCVLESLKCNFFQRLWEALTLTKRFRPFHFYRHVLCPGKIQ